MWESEIRGPLIKGGLRDKRRGLRGLSGLEI